MTDFEIDPKTGDLKEIITFPPGKKVAIVTSRGDVEDKITVPQFYEYMDEWLDFVAGFMKLTSKHFINQCGTMDDKKTALNDAALIEKAKAVGASFV